MLPVFEALAEQRRRQNGEAQTANLKQFQGSDRECQRFDTPGEGKARATEEAAAAVGTNRQYVSDAKRIAEDAPELLEKVRQGELSLPKAKALAALPLDVRAQILKRSVRAHYMNVARHFAKCVKLRHLSHRPSA